MNYLMHNLSTNSDSGNSYLQHFHVAQKNLLMVLKEQESSKPRPGKHKRAARIDYSIEFLR